MSASVGVKQHWSLLLYESPSIFSTEPISRCVAKKWKDQQWHQRPTYWLSKCSPHMCFHNQIPHVFFAANQTWRNVDNRHKIAFDHLKKQKHANRVQRKLPRRKQKRKPRRKLTKLLRRKPKRRPRRKKKTKQQSVLEALSIPSSGTRTTSRSGMPW